ncbi:MAG: NAD(P)H-dependent oxidoreductase [Pseudomonadota bacterium]
MATLLYIEASPRKDRSHGIRVAQAFLNAYSQANPDDTVDTLDLWAEKLPSFDGDRLNAKYQIMHGADASDAEKAAWGEIEAITSRFSAADKYVFSVPMWNFGIPYVLKHYIDVITQPGLSFSFDPAAGYSGLVQGKVLALLSSGGAYHDGSGAEAMDMQKPYLLSWLGFIGLTDVTALAVAPTLGMPEDVEAAVSAVEEQAVTLAASF